MLGALELACLVERIRRRSEQGVALTGTVRLADPTDGQRRAVARLLGRPPARGRGLTIMLGRLEEGLREAAVAPDLRTAVEVLVGPLADPPGVRADEHDRRDVICTALGRATVSGQAW